MRNFAAHVDISYSVWSDWENQKGYLGKQSLKKLSLVAGTTVDQLLDYLEGKNSLADYLRLRLTSMQDTSGAPFLTPDRIYTWLATLSLDDLQNLLEMVTTAMSGLIKKRITIASLIQKADINYLHQQTGIGITELEAISLGSRPCEVHLIKLGSVLKKTDGTHWTTSELHQIVRQEFPHIVEEKQSNGHT